MIDAKEADYVFHSLTPGRALIVVCRLYRVLLFASSIIAGWVENWFVLHRLDSALRYNPRITRHLGVARGALGAVPAAQHLRALPPTSLGFMLGLVPAICAFFGLGLRCATSPCPPASWRRLRQPGLGGGAPPGPVVGTGQHPLIGLLNLVVSFYLAFRVALRAHSVSAPARVRIRHAPAAPPAPIAQAVRVAQPGGRIRWASLT